MTSALDLGFVILSVLMSGVSVVDFFTDVFGGFGHGFGLFSECHVIAFIIWLIIFANMNQKCTLYRGQNRFCQSFFVKTIKNAPKDAFF